ncbi:glycosyltransferase [Undibacterium sp. TS12]|uniref:glycosyltransferase n=1 Tax=Undibacterium sp. TS12 TaxID=2908202 RepID=UPI001F4C9226|nr:glycosyltransferase [Undibacterium sp. TS12]MCH8622380.1 glycosyltransferase [Undibacterium sp. TS12]
MKFTGERFVPEVHGNIEIEHLHRYMQACNLARGKQVLDIASGEGYGSAMLAEHAAQVIGVDISVEAVEHAQGRYRKPNLEYRVGSCAAIPLDDSSVDLVVSFETIEHHDQHQEMMQEIRRVLRPDGVLLISSPDKLYYSDIPGAHNEYHVKELYQEEFQQLLGQYFGHISLFGQRVLFGSGIFPHAQATGFDTCWQQEQTLQSAQGMARPVYWIALASNRALPRLDASFFEQAQQESEMVTGLQTALEHRQHDIVLHKEWEAQLERDIADLKQWQTQLETDLAAQKQAQARLEFDVVQEQKKSAGLHRDVRDAELQCQRLQAELLQSASSHQELARQLQQEQQNVQDSQVQLRQLMNRLGESDASIASLRQERDVVLASIAEIRASRSWRYSAPLRCLGHIRRGNFAFVGHAARAVKNRCKQLLPAPVIKMMQAIRGKILNITAIMPHSSMNHAAIADMVAERHAALQWPISSFVPPMLAAAQCPSIDISVVTYNSGRWITGFVTSLLGLNYPKDRLSIYFVDNSSTDNTVEQLQAASRVLRSHGMHVEIIYQPNNGFGAGHNAGIRAGKAPFCLITNLDLTFEAQTLLQVVSAAVADSAQAAAWEMRQKPYEHPKYYDPVTGSTNWNSYACVLLRRSALDKVGGFDETLFMYGEDVELSYRLRRAGFVLRYCPQAVVWHFTYESEAQVKPLQYTGSTFANLYLRLKYGNRWDALAVPLLGLRLLLAHEAYPGSRKAVFRNLLRLVALTPAALLARRSSKVNFPFREWDYEMIRDGAFIAAQGLPATPPLVSIITRTYQGRSRYLREAILSVARQTYPNIEHLIVEDGGTSMQALVDEMRPYLKNAISHHGLDKCGRSVTGNLGLAQAKGRWCLFLDDDDLLFADHVEVLVQALLQNHGQQPGYRAAYSLAWEVPTNNSRIAQGEYDETTYMVPSALRQEYDYEVLRHHNFMPIQSVLFERSLYTERGGFEEDMEALEDWTLWVRYAHGNQFIHVPKLTSLYRTPADQDQIRQRAEVFAAAYALALTRNITRTQLIDAQEAAARARNSMKQESAVQEITQMLAQAES